MNFEKQHGGGAFCASSWAQVRALAEAPRSIWAVPVASLEGARLKTLSGAVGYFHSLSPLMGFAPKVCVEPYISRLHQKSKGEFR